MDAIHEPGTRELVIMSSSQLLKTEVLLNAIGYFAKQDPCPILLIQPTVKMAESFSKERLTPMIRDCPTLTEVFAEDKTRSSASTILKKQFRQGYVQMEGANSPAGLAMRSIRLLLCDEIDRYPISAGKEGDPIAIAQARQETFWNSLIIMTSSPTEKGASPIERHYELSDQRKCFLTCVHCRTPQVLTWHHVKFDKTVPKQALLHCEHCGAPWTEPARQAMLQRHEWRPTAEAQIEGRVGFHGSKLYSPWKQPYQLVIDFLEKKKERETLKAWVNTTLGESFEVPGDRLQWQQLYARRAHWGAVIPNGSLLTGGIDVQHDRFEITLVSWGAGEEAWVVSHYRLYGDMSAQPVWDALSEFLRRERFRADGQPMPVALACIDSGAYTDEVYKFSRRNPRVWIPTKGSSEHGKPIAELPRQRNKQRVYLTMLGVDTAKDLLYDRLTATEPGPGYVHFPVTDEFDEEYFKQLAAEVRVPKFKAGRRYYVYEARRVRNEALDCMVLNVAAVRILQRHQAHKLATLANVTVSEQPAAESLQSKPAHPRVAPPSRREQQLGPRPRRRGFF